MESLLEMYAVQNQDGQWFRAKGMNGGGKTWVDDLKKAKIYPKIGAARRTVTWFANNFPDFAIPALVKLKVTEIEAVVETERVKKSQKDKATKEAEFAKQQAIWNREYAERKLKEAQDNLDKLNKDNNVF